MKKKKQKRYNIDAEEVQPSVDFFNNSNIWAFDSYAITENQGMCSVQISVKRNFPEQLSKS